MEKIGFLLGFVCLLTWGVSDIISKKGIHVTTILKFLFWSQLIGAAFIAALGVLQNKLVGLNADVWAWMMLLGFLNVIAMALYYKSFQLKGVALSVSIVKAWVLAVTLMSIIFYRYYPSPKEWLAMTLVLIGLFTISKKSGKLFHLDRSYALPFVTMLVVATTFFLIDVAGSRIGEIWVSMGAKAFSAIFLLPLFFKNPLDLFKMSRLAWLLVCVVGVLDGAGLVAFAYGTQLGSITQISTVVSAAPAFVAVLSVLFLKERLTAQQGIGIGCAALGLVLLAIL